MYQLPSAAHAEALAIKVMGGNSRQYYLATQMSVLNVCVCGWVLCRGGVCAGEVCVQGRFVCMQGMCVQGRCVCMGGVWMGIVQGRYVCRGGVCVWGCAHVHGVVSYIQVSHYLWG